MITVVYRCPSCQSRWVDPREGLSRNESHGAVDPYGRPRQVERLCRACARDEERWLWETPVGRQADPDKVG